MPGHPPPRPQTATLYMSDSVGIAELRQNLSRYLRRVQRGERLLVTDRNRPVAELGPPPTSVQPSTGSSPRDGCRVRCAGASLSRWSSQVIRMR